MAPVRVTLRDVAHRVGVHPSTVSRVLNPDTRHMVSPEIARRVTEAADRLGYHPNPIAYTLRTNRSHMVGVVLPDITNPLFPPIIRGIEDTLGDAGYTAVMANSDNDDDRERTILNRMRARRIDGLILATARLDDALIDACVEENIPLVLINRTIQGAGVSSVVTDDAGGIRLAVAHLAKLGHTRIAHVAGTQSLSTGRNRYHGFLRAMEAEGLTPDPDLVVFCQSFTEEQGYLASTKLFESGRDFTAIVAGNDLVAIGCVEAIRERGLACPGGVSVTGFNDMPYADKLNPPLTTIRIPHYEMGVQAGHMLLELMQAPTSNTRTVTLQPELVVRDSTAEPRKR